VASITRELVVERDASVVWQAFRDVGAIHLKLARGFVVDTVLDGGERIVTFVNGCTVRERIVTVDDAARRLVYAAVAGRTTHHNASFHVQREGPSRSRVVWTTDLLPDDAAGAVEGMMDRGVEAMRETLGSGTA
jgi:hypothetical protein